jgi:hypothetical protein
MRILFLTLLSLSVIFGESTKIPEKPVDATGYTDYEKWHEYSGYITLGLLGATIATIGNDEIHEKFGVASAVGMLTTTTTGYLAHGDDVLDFSDGFKQEHWHSLLGFIGAAAILMSVSVAPEHQHAGLGVLGGISAGLSFAIIEW